MTKKPTKAKSSAKTKTKAAGAKSSAQSQKNQSHGHTKEQGRTQEAPRGGDRPDIGKIEAVVAEAVTAAVVAAIRPVISTALGAIAPVINMALGGIPPVKGPEAKREPDEKKR